jgi:hypothetical protein
MSQRAMLRRSRLPLIATVSWALMACSPSDEPTGAVGTAQSSLVGDKLSPIFGKQPNAKAVRLVVKFKEGSEARMRGGRLSANASAAALAPELRAIESELSARGLVLGRLFGRMSDAQLQDVKQRGEARTGKTLPDLGLYHQIPASSFGSDADLEQMRRYFAGMDSVEAAYVEHEPAPTPDANSPDLRSFQTYKNPAPFGMDVAFATSVAGARGTGVRLIDVESALRPGHEDNPVTFYTRGDVVVERAEHAAAVAGIIAGRDNAIGGTGIAPDVQFGSSSYFPFTSTSIAEAMTAPLASGDLRSGDLLLMELQVTGPGVLACACQQSFCDRFVPGEFQAAIFDAVRTLVGNGVSVIEAAGNGAVNLDDPAFSGMFDRNVRDSGAILVGARVPHTGGVQCFGNYGSRIDVNAWGSGVFTSGYGDRYQGALAPNDFYTQSFGGTSSASALTAGAGASLQGIARASTGSPLSPSELRDLMRATGSAQSADLDRPNGVHTDLRRAIGVLQGSPRPPIETVYVDSFEPGFSFFSNVGTQLSWTRLSGPTPSANTGPAGDHTTGGGSYVYTEATGTAGSPNKTAILQGRCLDLRGHSAARFSLFFHMLGSQMGTLAVEADAGCDGGPLVTLFTQTGQRTGSELNGYVRQEIDLAQFLGQSLRLRVRGTTGSGGLSDIAIDDLRIVLAQSGDSGCTSDTQCAPGVCEAQRCVECRADSGCAGGVCVANECAECRTAEQCPAGSTCNPATNVCTTAACTNFAATTQQHIDAGRATTVRVSTRVEARVLGSNQLLESRSLFGSFSATIRTLRTRTAGGFEIGSCP